MRVPEPPRIYVIAGVNGGGKSSLAGAAFREFGGFYYNPDEAARQLMTVNPGIRQEDANSAAWQQGVRLLKRVIQERLDFAFETTLGGNTITQLLARAAGQGVAIHVWYVGLFSPELHIQRVRSRVGRGGHDIPEEDIRRRYEHSRVNLITLLPHLSSLRMFDNSVEVDPAEGHAPSPQLILHMENRRILASADFSRMPNWAKPIVAAVLKLSQA
jgi:predicted ABC-type ATPase